MPSKKKTSSSSGPAGAGASAINTPTSSSILTTSTSTSTAATPTANSNSNSSSSSSPIVYPPTPTLEKAEDISARIIAHMNADHEDSLARYIQHFGRVWALSARRPKLLRLDRDSMTIASTGPVGSEDARGLHTTISFQPQLHVRLSDARRRLIEMDDEAKKALGRNDIAVRRYQPPTRTWEWAWWAFVAAAWVVFSRRANLFEGAYFFDAVLTRCPIDFVVFLRAWQARIFYVMLGLHTLETLEMASGKLRRYNVELGSPVWWAWTLSVAFEGFPVWARFDHVVEEESERKKRTMH